MCIEVLFENDAILVVNKPAGILTQAARGVESLELRVKSYLARHRACSGEPNESNENIQASDDLSSVYLGVPHRLDRPVSGVILFGKYSRATHRLSVQFENREIDKTYWGIAEGVFDKESDTWIDYMRKIPDKPLAEIVQPINPDAREAILNYKKLRQFDIDGKPFALLEIKLETGRMHQIRLQAKTHGHPILGDATYNSTHKFGDSFDNERSREIALHARSISFKEPLSKTQINLTAPLPKIWKPYTDSLQLE
ncbi:MAG: RluA family pseudouridine synthase [Planctomycetaceae bacterium]|jgi:RluA family pseudouridine synthase|nr:RluA family pseudouridine synthase [Planctomycetaceae bacterium]